MRYRFMRFPKGLGKAITLSYDDGSKQDMRFARLLDRYGLKCTFNLNGEALRADWDYCMTKEEVEEYILKSGHEIAIHGLEHRAAGTLRPVEGIREVLDCRVELEQRYGRIIRGMAYPDGGICGFVNGATYEDVKSYLGQLDIAYARSLEKDNNDFSLPEDWYNWMPNLHQGSDKMERVTDEFLSIDRSPKGHVDSGCVPLLLYIWGHSSEFGTEEDWTRIEKLCEKLSGKEDVWYATNIEIYDYVKAYESLVFSAKGDIVYNPTLLDVWFDVDGKLYEVKSGESIRI